VEAVFLTNRRGFRPLLELIKGKKGSVQTGKKEQKRQVQTGKKEQKRQGSRGRIRDKSISKST
jgi:hypothetical protein